jgi:hypothetical protein
MVLLQVLEQQVETIVGDQTPSHLCATLCQMSADASPYDACTNHYYLGHGSSVLDAWMPTDSWCPRCCYARRERSELGEHSSRGDVQMWLSRAVLLATVLSGFGMLRPSDCPGLRGY